MGSLDFAALRRAEVGSRLRVARERIGFSLDDIQRATRIPVRHLEAIEQGDASGLPSPAYATGFVRAYARELGLDAAALVRVYRGEAERAEGAPHASAEAEPAPALPAIVEPAADSGLPRALLVAGAAILLLLLVLGAVILLRPGPRPGASVELPPLQPALAAPAGQRVDLPAADEDLVEIKASERVWMRVYEASGRTLFSGLLAPGGSYRVPAEARDPRINTGNPQALVVTLGGKPVMFTRRPSVSAARLSPEALRAPPRDEPERRDRRARRQRSQGADMPAASETLPALAVTTKDATPTVTTPLENAQ